MRRYEIDPPGAYIFNRHLLNSRLQYHVLQSHQMRFLNGGMGPTEHMHPCPSSEIAEDLGCYPVYEVQAARSELINELYLAPNVGRTVVHRIREVTGIIPRRDGVFIPAMMVPGRITYSDQSTSQLSEPWPSYPSSDSDSDSDSVQEDEDEDSTQVEYSNQIKHKHVDNADSNIPSTSNVKKRRTADGIILIE